MSYRAQREHRPGRRTALAFCYHCDATWEGNNCQGTAARHTDATGHQTCVEVTQCQIYYVPGKEWRWKVPTKESDDGDDDRAGA